MAKTSFTGRTAVVTGAGSGIGRATAIQVAEKGARLVLTDVDTEGLAQTVALVQGSVVHHEALDVSDQTAVAAFARRAIEAGPVGIVVNLAVPTASGRIQDLSPHDWRDCVETDLMGPIHILSAFVPAMIEAGRGGHVVNVSSAAGLLGLPLRAPSSAAAAGLRGVSEVLRLDLEAHGIGVTLMCPGADEAPDAAAAALIRGVERGRHLVLTSRDDRRAHLLRRYAPWAHDRVMRRLSRRLARGVEHAPAPVERLPDPPMIDPDLDDQPPWVTRPGRR